MLDHLKLDAHSNCTAVTLQKQTIQLYYDYLIKLSSVCCGFITLTSVVLLVCCVYNKRKTQNIDIRGSDRANTVITNVHDDIASEVDQYQSEYDEILALN
jgi:hypothetical protein